VFLIDEEWNCQMSMLSLCSDDTLSMFSASSTNSSVDDLHVDFDKDPKMSNLSFIPSPPSPTSTATPAGLFGVPCLCLSAAQLPKSFSRVDPLLWRQRLQALRASQAFSNDSEDSLLGGSRSFGYDDDDCNSDASFSDAFGDGPMSTTVHLRPVRALTRDLLETIKGMNSDFHYKPKYTAPKRILTNPSLPRHNNGEDNENYDLILHVGDVLGSSCAGDQHDYCWRHGSKYTVVEMLGRGTFGQVVKCRDERTDKLVAVKVLKNKRAYFKQGLLEIGVLTAMNTNADPTGSLHTLRLYDHFLYRNHLCVVNELLSMNLYELIKQNGFRGISAALIRSFVYQVLLSLDAMERAEIIHCDMKPENILLQNLQGFDISLIDFGSACFEDNTMYSYIQSRHYRSPEVLLGLRYSCAIDMWSLGCIAAELFLGIPIFPGANEYNQLFKIIEMLGMPPSEMIKLGSRSSKFFAIDTAATTVAARSGSRSVEYRLKTMAEYERDNGVRIEPDRRYFAYRSLEELVMNHPMKTGATEANYTHPAWQEMEIRRSFFHFLRGCLEIDPTKRWTPAQALAHPFLHEKVLPQGWAPPPPRRPPFPIQPLTQADLAGSSKNSAAASAAGGAAPGVTAKPPTDMCGYYQAFAAGIKRHEVIDVATSKVLFRLADPLRPMPRESSAKPRVVTRGNRSRSMSDARLQQQMMAVSLNSPRLQPATPPKISMLGIPSLSSSSVASSPLHSPPMPVNGGGLRTPSSSALLPGSVHNTRKTSLTLPISSTHERSSSSSSSGVPSAASIGSRILQNGGVSGGGRRTSATEKKKTSRRSKRASYTSSALVPPPEELLSSTTEETSRIRSGHRSNSVASLKSLASPGTSALTVQSPGESNARSKNVRISVAQQNSNVAAASWGGGSPQYALYVKQYGKEPSSTSSGSSGSPSAIGSPTQDLASIIGSIPPPGSGPSIPLGTSATTNYAEREMNRRRQQQCNQQQQRLVLQPSLQPLDFSDPCLLDDFMA